MDKILHQLRVVVYSIFLRTGFVNRRWLFGISSINRIHNWVVVLNIVCFHPYLGK